MTDWYEFFPSDTLFFRGAEPLDAGMDYKTELIFPPPCSVIEGALRTAVLAQKSISVADYSRGHEIEELIGTYGNPAPFKVIGPILKKNSVYYLPAPYTFFTEEDESAAKIKVLVLEPLQEEIKDRLGIGAAKAVTHWVRHCDEATPLGGKWISLDALHKLSRGRARLDTRTEILIHPDCLALSFTEKRTGIALESNRSVKQGKIYNANHVRLDRDVSLVWGLDSDCGLASEGVLCLGGEQRFGGYVLMEKAPCFPETGHQFLALGPVPVSGPAEKYLIAAGKPVYRGGWDYKNQFHKPMKPFYPAGSVFSEKIEPNCIEF
jgi:CRISPR-associated protein Cmr3